MNVQYKLSKMYNFAYVSLSRLRSKLGSRANAKYVESILDLNGETKLHVCALIHDSQSIGDNVLVGTVC